MGREFGPSIIETERKSIGAGKPWAGNVPTGSGAAGEMVAALVERIQCGAGDLPTLWQVRGHWQGPLLDSAISTLFQPQTDILSLGKNLPGVAPGGVSTTQGLNNGELQTPSLICGVFVHVAPGPYCYTVPGAGWTKPTTPKNSPVVPDTWTSLDVTGTPNALGLTGGAPSPDTFVRGSMDYNNWSQDGLWDMCRAFNFVWSYGDKTTLLDWPLRHIAWMPPNAQNGTSGGGPVKTLPDISAMNTYYANAGGSSLIFLPRNARRTGSVVTAAGPVVSTFAPDDTYREVVPTVGGVGLREGVHKNTEVFMLPRPVLYPRGVSLGMYLNEKDGTAFSQMQQQFSITNGLGLPPTSNGAVPPAYTPYSNISAGYGAGASGGTLPTFIEQSKDVSLTQTPLQIRGDEVVFKWGDLYIAIGAVGFELTETQYQFIVQQKGAIADGMAAANCPCMFM